MRRRHIVIGKERPSFVRKIHGNTLCGIDAWDLWYHYRPTREELDMWETSTCKTCRRAWERRQGDIKAAMESWERVFAQ